MHVHVVSSEGEAKFWLEPAIELAQNWGLTPSHLALAKQLIEARSDEVRAAWQQHFS
jgi:hypothetical protein